MRSGGAAAGTQTVNAILASGVNFVQFTSGVNTVQFQSGVNLVQTSGQTVLLASGTGPIIISTSGNVAITSISGNVVVMVSGYVSVSGNIVNTSGQVAAISGQIVGVSGQAVTISGNVVNVSGQSFQPSYNNSTSVRARNILSVTAASGGTLLNSGDCSQITIRALSGNAGVIYVGGTGTERAWGNNATSGNGFQLGPGDGLTFPISNMNLVSVSAFSGTGVANSGDKISYMSVQY
jgi:hypothetical protein